MTRTPFRCRTFPGGHSQPMEEFCEGTFEKTCSCARKWYPIRSARKAGTNQRLTPPFPQSNRINTAGTTWGRHLVSSKHRAMETHIWSPREIEPMGLAPWIWPAGGRDDNNKRGQPELRGVNIWMGQLMKRTTTAPGSRPVPSQRKLRGGRRRGGEDEGGQPASTETQDALSPDGAA